MKRLIGILLLISCQTASAQPGDASGFSLLRLEPSARIASLAGAAVALGQGDPSTPFLNPALLGTSSHRMFSTSYLNHLSDINAGFVSYIADVGKIGTMMGGLRYLSYGSFVRADENGFQDGSTFGAYETALTIGLGRKYGERLNYGASFHTLFSGIDGASSGAVALDVGVYYYVDKSQLGLSASLNNFGWVYNTVGEQSDDLPTDIRVGAAKQMSHLPLLITVMGYNLNDFSGTGDSFGNEVLKHIALGGEFQLGTAVRFRIGYNHQRHSDLKTDSRLDLAGVGLGFGINVTRFRFDYAYNDWSALGGLHHLTVQTRL